MAKGDEHGTIWEAFDYYCSVHTQLKYFYVGIYGFRVSFTFVHILKSKKFGDCELDEKIDAGKISATDYRLDG